MTSKSEDHLKAALNHLTVACTAAEEERREAIQVHGGGHFNLEAKKAEHRFATAHETFVKLERLMQQQTY